MELYPLISVPQENFPNHLVVWIMKHFLSISLEVSIMWLFMIIKINALYKQVTIAVRLMPLIVLLVRAMI
ncbi:hypothetical protein D3C87_2053380 [compost metagenome]